MKKKMKKKKKKKRKKKKKEKKQKQNKHVPRVRIELTTFRCLIKIMRLTRCLLR